MKLRAPLGIAGAAARGAARSLAMAFCLALPAPACMADDGSLSQLAEQARAGLSRRVEPPAAESAFACLVDRRLQAAPVREYVLRQQAEAVRALIEIGQSADQAPRVRRLLGELARDGYSSDAARLLADRPAPAAVRLRQATAIGELPAALDKVIHAGCGGGLYVGLMSTTMQPLGRQARSSYERIAELDGNDPWAWLVLAWLGTPDVEAVLQRSAAAAAAGGTADAQRAGLVVQQALVQTRLDQGRMADAEQAARGAYALALSAQQRAAGADTDTALQASADVAHTGRVLADALARGQHAEQAAALLKTLLPLQQGLAASRPDDVSLQYDLIDVLVQLEMAQRLADPAAASAPRAGEPGPLNQAMALHQALVRRTPYAPMLGRSSWPGMMLVAIVGAALLAFPLGLVLLWRFRVRVAHWMMAASRASGNGGGVAEVAAPAAPAPMGASGGAQVVAMAARAQRQAAAAQVAGGLAFGLAAAWLQLRYSYGLAPNANRLLVMAWTWAWPTVLALGIVWDGDRRRQRLAWAAYFAGLALICIKVSLGSTPPVEIFGVRVPALLQGLVFWGMTLSYTPLLLLFMNRTLRAIGPSLMTMLLVATAGGFVAEVLVSMPIALPAAVTALMWLHVPATLMIAAVDVLGMLAFAPLAWWAGRGLRAAYLAKWTSDQSLLVDTFWLAQTLVLCIDLVQGTGAVGWLAVVAFVVYKIVVMVALWPAVRAARQRRPLRLLLLRVFTRRDAQGRQVSRRAEAERLFDLLGSRWRYAGPIRMIGAPDLADSTIGPDEFLDFLAGRLRDRFLLEPAELPARISALDERCDADARWRVNELYCGNDTWRGAVQALMARSDVVAMDLRDFGPDNQGCLFELKALAELVPADRVALLVDRSTRLDFLDSVLASMRRTSGTTAMSRVSLDRGEGAAVDELLRLAARG